MAASYQVGCIDKSRNIPGLKQRNIHKQGNPSVKSQFWNPQTRSRVGTLPKANPFPSALARYRLGFSQAHWCYNDNTTESISFMLRKTVVIILQKKKTSFPPSHMIIEDTFRHNIAQMTSTSKAYIPCLLATIIK